VSGRIRSVKPESLKDEELWDAEMQTGLPLFRAFVGLWCQADRRGRFEWRPRKLKSEVLPYWEGEFERVLDALTTCGFLVSYVVGERRYGWLPTFEKHQFINGKEPESRLPAPPDWEAIPDASRVTHTSNTCEAREAHAPIQIPSRSLPDPAPDPGPDPDARAEAPEPSALQAKAQAYLDDSNSTAMAHGTPDVWPEVCEAARRFAAVWPTEGKLRGFRDPRVARIVERLAEGFTVDELAAAAKGSKLDEHIAGSAAFQTIATVWRDAAQVEKFKRLLTSPPAKAPPRRPGGYQRPPDHGVDLRARQADLARQEAAERAAKETPHAPAQ
jgi:hypothetical protein